MPLESGTRLGPYEILGTLGAGGMGEVYRARDTRLDRSVAIKVLPQNAPISSEERARFRREAKAISALNHPHICVLYDAGQDAGIDYLVMELVEGESLARRLSRGPLPTADVLRIGAQIADALDRAHRAGVVHRDLKPANVMLTKNGAKLMDFGLARRDGHSVWSDATGTENKARRTTASDEPITAKGMVVGTLQYMSPEQLEGKHADARSDIWAMGCLLYEMATGKKAFEGATAVSIISTIMRGEPRVMSELAPLAPPAFQRVVHQCLAKEPDDRWQTAGDLRRELVWIGEASSGAMASFGSVKRAGPRWVPWAVTGVVSAAAVASALLGWRSGSDDRGALRFRQMTFQPFSISRALFTPDGRSIVFSAEVDGKPWRVFLLRPEYPEPQPISEPGTYLLSVSSRGELAVLIGTGGVRGDRRPELARMPLGGGAPRPILEGVQDAAWSPDGTDLAIVLISNGRSRLEYPIGKVLWEERGSFSDPRFSPDGKSIALVHHPNPSDNSGRLVVVDLDGKLKCSTEVWDGATGIAWANNGKEIYFSSSEDAMSGSVQAVSLRGRSRPLIQSAGGFTIHDVGPEGQLLGLRDEVRRSVIVHRANWPKDRDLSWLQESARGHLLGRGDSVVFSDWSTGKYSVCLRDVSGSPVVRLGDGSAMAVSRNGRWVLAVKHNHDKSDMELVRYPIGTGAAQPIDVGSIEQHGSPFLSPSGDSVLYGGAEAGRKPRLYVQGVSGGQRQPVTPEGVGEGLPSPNFDRVLAWDSERSFAVYPLRGGPGTPVRGLNATDTPLRFDGNRTATVARLGRPPIPLHRVDLVTGQRKEFMAIEPDRPTFRINWVDVTEDGQTCTYETSSALSTLFVVDRSE